MTGGQLRRLQEPGPNVVAERRYVPRDEGGELAGRPSECSQTPTTMTGGQLRRLQEPGQTLLQAELRFVPRDEGGELAGRRQSAVKH